MSEHKELVTEQKNLTPIKATKEAAKNLHWQRDKDREKVKGIFRFHEVPGGCLSFVYKCYKNEQVERFDMVDGQIYTVPLGVAKHLNKNLWYPEYSYVKSEGVYGAHGMPGTGQTMKATKKVRRCSFQSLEFIDVEEVPTNVSPIVTMENI